ncbi:hypothetical protein SAMN04488700_0367 [Carnobacterium iners]|uniref:Uncharacterized protein n=1 Tax=Carnobacterium iners TaxID=1073423 RepID=A0A1X7MRN3_9LACT|nr:hypothetical protein [Carnobacterium iners]SEL30433.1 hypothetical protein SAMN04488114_1493 [Carnobacterium iners]SMH26981.1 hypothetical protein SAMN04488700_0367 [Carnobacterium iners]
MKNYSDNKIPKLISRPILGALTAVIVIFVVKLLFDIPPAVHDFIFDTVFVLIIRLAIYRTFFKKPSLKK